MFEESTTIQNEYDGEGTTHSVNPGVDYTQLVDDTEIYVSTDGTVDAEKMAGHASMFSTIVNSIKVTIGAGVLSAPFAVARGSSVPGSVVVVALAVMSATTFVLVGYACEKTNSRSYGELWTKTYGKKYEWVINVALGFLTFFGALSYGIVVGDFFSELFEFVVADHYDGIVLSRHFWILIIGVCILLPLTCLKNLHSLRFSSYLGVVGIAYTVVLMITLFFTNDNDNNDGESPIHPEVEHFKVDPIMGIFQTISIFSFAFCAHIQAPILYAELKDHTPKLWSKIGTIAYSCIFVIYMSYGLTGFWAYGPDVASNSISSMPTDKVTVVMARLMMGFSVIASFPLLFFALRFAVHELILDYRQRANKPEWSQAKQEQVRKIEIVVLWSIIIGLSNVFEDIGNVMGFAGAGPGTLLMFVFPVFIYLKLYPVGKETSPNYYYSYMLIMFVGVVGGLIALVVTIIDMVS